MAENFLFQPVSGAHSIRLIVQISMSCASVLARRCILPKHKGAIILNSIAENLLLIRMSALKWKAVYVWPVEDMGCNCITSHRSICRAGAWLALKLCCVGIIQRTA